MEASVPLSLARADVREAQRRRVSVLPKLHAWTASRSATWARRRSKRSGTASQCSACGVCIRPDGRVRSTSAPSAARRFHTRRWLTGSLLLHGRTVRTLLPMGGAAGVFFQTSAALLKPPTVPQREDALVQIEPAEKRKPHIQSVFLRTLPFSTHIHKECRRRLTSSLANTNSIGLLLRMTPGLGTRTAGQLIQKLRTPEAIFRASATRIEGHGLSRVASTVVGERLRVRRCCGPTE